jgi:hypothetical protein
MSPNTASSAVLKTPFGDWLDTKNISYAEAAKQLGITRSYVQMLAVGNATPQLALAGRIEDWTRGDVSMRSWLPYCRSGGGRA